MKAIVAVDKKWGIGKNNGLLFQIAEDMRFFRQQTLGKTVVMGRKTLESFPNGKPLKNRKNVVLGNPKNAEGITSVKNFEELKTALSGENLLDVYVIGGGSVVVKDIPGNCVAVGNPCKVIRAITEEDKQTCWDR